MLQNNLRPEGQVVGGAVGLARQNQAIAGQDAEERFDPGGKAAAEAAKPQYCGAERVGYSVTSGFTVGGAAMTGAAIGSIVPGSGTVVGAAAGLLVGAAGGDIAGSWDDEHDDAIVDAGGEIAGNL